MEHVLLILVLFGDPSGEKVAKGLGDELARIGGAQVQVVVGAEAAKQLDGRGVKMGDILAAPNIGLHLTSSDKDLAVIWLERQDSAGDVVVSSRVWLEGKSDKHVAIAGNGGDPLSGVVSGVMPLLAHRLPGKAGAGNGAADEINLDVLVEKKQWLEILGKLAGVKDKTARQYYYQVLAYSRLDQRDPAVAALNQLRVAFPGHFLIAAADELIPLPPTPPPAKRSGDEGNTLRDAPAVKDDGGNTLK